MEHIPKASLIHIEEGRLLCARTRGRPVAYNVGGKPKPGETYEQALIREVNEELQVEILPETIQFFGEYSAQADNQPEGQMVTSRYYFARFNGIPRPGREIEELMYLKSTDKDKTTPLCGKVMDILKDKGLMD